MMLGKGALGRFGVGCPRRARSIRAGDGSYSWASRVRYGTNRRRTMTDYLFYGEREIRISDDEDLAALKGLIDHAFKSGEDPWFEVHGADAVYQIRASVGIPVGIRTVDSSVVVF